MGYWFKHSTDTAAVWHMDETSGSSKAAYGTPYTMTAPASAMIVAGPGGGPDKAVAKGAGTDGSTTNVLISGPSPIASAIANRSFVFQFDLHKYVSAYEGPDVVGISVNGFPFIDCGHRHRLRIPVTWESEPTPGEIVRIAGGLDTFLTTYIGIDPGTDESIFGYVGEDQRACGSSAKIGVAAEVQMSSPPYTTYGIIGTLPGAPITLSGTTAYEMYLPYMEWPDGYIEADYTKYFALGNVATSTRFSVIFKPGMGAGKVRPVLCTDLDTDPDYYYETTGDADYTCPTITSVRVVTLGSYGSGQKFAGYVSGVRFIAAAKTPAELVAETADTSLSVVGAGASTPNTVTIEFDKAIYGHNILSTDFTIDGGVSVSAASIPVTGYPNKIELTTSSLVTGTTYTITVVNPIYTSDRGASFSGTVVFYYDTGIPTNYSLASAGYIDRGESIVDAGFVHTTPIPSVVVSRSTVTPNLIQAPDESGIQSAFNTGFN